MSMLFSKGDKILIHVCILNVIICELNVSMSTGGKTMIIGLWLMCNIICTGQVVFSHNRKKRHDINYTNK